MRREGASSSGRARRRPSTVTDIALPARRAISSPLRSRTSRTAPPTVPRPHRPSLMDCTCTPAIDAERRCARQKKAGRYRGAADRVNARGRSVAACAPQEAHFSSEGVGWHVAGEHAAVFEEQGRSATDTHLLTEAVLRRDRVRARARLDRLARLEASERSLRVLCAPGGDEFLRGRRTDARRADTRDSALRCPSR